MFMSLSVFAQQPYVCTVEGTSMEYTTLNAKGKQEGPVSVEKVTSVKKVGGATEVVVTKELEGMTIPQKYVVQKDNVFIAKETLFPAELLKEQGVNAEVEGDDIVYPLGVTAGMVLPDITISVIMTFDQAPGMFQMVDVTAKNRKCLAEEEITVPAGTFNCIVIEETMTQAATFNGQQQSETTKNKMWYSDGVGMVKEENYTGRGKLLSTKELTKFTKPE